MLNGQGSECDIPTAPATDQLGLTVYQDGVPDDQGVESAAWGDLFTELHLEAGLRVCSGLPEQSWPAVLHNQGSVSCHQYTHPAHFCKQI